VALYQETGYERYFEDILIACRGYIQGSASRDSDRTGIDSAKCESQHCMSLWSAAKTFDPTMNVPFGAFVVLKLKIGIKRLLSNENRRESFHSPENNAGFNKNEEQPGTLRYTLEYLITDTEWDLEDKNPYVDAQNLVFEDESAKGLLEAISEEDKVAADIAWLTACGYSQREVARALDYNPIGVSKQAQNMWVIRKLMKCVTPAQKYYKKLGMPIPLKMRAG
jgi:hypothetical protein